MAAFDSAVFDTGTFDAAAAVVYAPVTHLGWNAQAKATTAWGATGDTKGAVWAAQNTRSSGWASPDSVSGTAWTDKQKGRGTW
jgi:hypothetical protein